MAVSGADNEHGIGNGLSRVGIMLIHIEIGADLVLDDQRTGLAGEQLHLILPQVNDVVRQRGRFTHGIHTRFHIANQDLSALIGGAVEIMRPVFNLRNPEGDSL